MHNAPKLLEQRLPQDLHRLLRSAFYRTAGGELFREKARFPFSSPRDNLRSDPTLTVSL